VPSTLCTSALCAPHNAGGTLLSHRVRCSPPLTLGQMLSHGNLVSNLITGCVLAAAHSSFGA
jgi:hypothetical protein